MGSLRRLLSHLVLLWHDHQGRYDPALAARSRRLLADCAPLSAGWIDALRTSRKLDPEAAKALETITGHPLRTRSASRLAFLLAYLLESGRQDQAIELFERYRPRLSGLIAHNPALCWLAHRQQADEAQPPLARLFRQADHSRRRFEDWVRDRDHHITLLGNGPIEQPPQLADAADHLVIDFNQPGHGLDLPPGCRRARVRTPNRSVPPLADQALDWVLFTGDNSLYQRIHFTPLLAAAFSPEKYLFVPSHIWLELVTALQAPPSAGLIMLHWIAGLRGGLETVSLHGFSILPGDQPLNDKPGRHRWQRERDFLRRWLG